MGLAVQVCATSHLATGAMPCLLDLIRTNVTFGMVYQSLQCCTCFFLRYPIWELWVVRMKRTLLSVF